MLAVTSGCLALQVLFNTSLNNLLHNLPVTEVSLTGLQLPGSSFLPFLKTGAMFATFCDLSRLSRQFKKPWRPPSQGHQPPLGVFSDESHQAPWTHGGPAGALEWSSGLSSAHCDPLTPSLVLKTEVKKALNNFSLWLCL